LINDIVLIFWKEAFYQTDGICPNLPPSFLKGRLKKETAKPFPFSDDLLNLVASNKNFDTRLKQTGVFIVD